MADAGRAAGTWTASCDINQEIRAEAFAGLAPVARATRSSMRWSM